jgi:probable phosphoglycerate mutase
MEQIDTTVHPRLASGSHMTELLQTSRRFAWDHPAERETTLYLVRHGRTKGNVDHTICGRLDLPLDDLGLLQAQRVADRIAREVRADALLSSPLIRARRTAEFIGERSGLTATIIDDLAEWNFGDYEGRTIAEVMEVAPEVLLALENLDDDEAGWPGGETRRVFHARVAGVFREIARSHHGQSAIVVCHGGVLGSLAAQVHGVSPNDWSVFNILNCSLSHFTLSSGVVDVIKFNDVEHLADLIDESREG